MKWFVLGKSSDEITEDKSTSEISKKLSDLQLSNEKNAISSKDSTDDISTSELSKELSDKKNDTEQTRTYKVFIDAINFGDVALVKSFLLKNPFFQLGFPIAEQNIIQALIAVGAAYKATKRQQPLICIY